MPKKKEIMTDDKFIEILDKYIKPRIEDILERTTYLEDFQERAIKYITALERRIKKLEGETKFIKVRISSTWNPDWWI